MKNELYTLVELWLEGHLERVITQLETLPRSTLVDFLALLIKERHLRENENAEGELKIFTKPLSFQGWQDLARLSEMLT